MDGTRLGNWIRLTITSLYPTATGSRCISLPAFNSLLPSPCQGDRAGCPTLVSWSFRIPPLSSLIASRRTHRDPRHLPRRAAMAGRISGQRSGKALTKTEPQPSSPRSTLVCRMRAGHAAGVDNRRSGSLPFPQFPLGGCISLAMSIMLMEQLSEFS